MDKPDVRDPRDARLDGINARNDAAPLALVRDVADPKVLTAEAEAFDRAARCLRHMGLPGGNVEETDAAYGRGLMYGYQIAVLRLQEQARSRRELLAIRGMKAWEANAPTDPAA